ncbi:adenosylmethionine-8-amino-7-oxononanoate transaminase [Naematelia encephala]|uniref:Adenosylmethionine-8-amino-7-oxononanoate transaminase n=1 Tax=Naematelia encephala TaxID=71784 RepID=A0A1Y2AG86_9TREE|nr:adenosylmethionine-8-amino-7-oxononanoate transaminase [Naematelia encephala]
MPLLFPNLRITQIFGANTEVGKTLLTTAIVRATAARYARNGEERRKRVFYLKPVSTGPDSESDVSYVERHTKPFSGMVGAHNLYQYREPMSPHLAAQLAPDLPFPESNDDIVRGVERYARQCLSSLDGQRGSLFVETAGGVHSPALHPPHTQSTFLRSLLLPCVLIASPHLGGISTTLTSYESLLLRGYHISAVLCLHQPYYQNHTFLADYFAERGVSFWTIDAPPERHGTVDQDAVRLGEWYAGIEGRGDSVGGVADFLDEEHDTRIAELEGMPQRTLNSVWWPFTQHGLINKKEDVMVIDSAHGDHFDAYYSEPDATQLPSPSATDSDSLLKSYFDGSASWFTQSHGHASEPLALAAAHAAGRYGHVLFPSGTHAPALNLAEKLIETVGENWAERVFYSDNGSTAMEVALKMAIRAAGRRYGWEGELGEDVGVIGLRGGYHGDTIGSMDASEASTFNTAVDWYRGRGYWFSPPQVHLVNGKPTISTTPPDSWPELPSSLSSSYTGTADGWQLQFNSLADIYDLSSRLSSRLANYYRKHIRSTLARLTKDQGRRFGALVMEPTCLGAGGMVFVDPLFQACMIEVVRSSSDLFGSPSSNYEDDLERLPTRKNTEWQGLPVIYDEVFSGLHRFGYNSAASVLGHTPDISAYAKILTGGLLPLSATLASSSIFNSFLSDEKVDALLHGHSYTANPIGCAVALKAIEMVQGKGKKWEVEQTMWKGKGRWSFWSPTFLERVSRFEGIKGVMGMGTVLAIELEDTTGGYSSHIALDFLTSLRNEIVHDSQGQFEPFQIHSRPLGNIVYIITSLFTRPQVMRGMEAVIEKKLNELKAK